MPTHDSNLSLLLPHLGQDYVNFRKLLVFKESDKQADAVNEPHLISDASPLLVVLQGGDKGFFEELVRFLNDQEWVRVEEAQEKNLKNWPGIAPAPWISSGFQTKTPQFPAKPASPVLKKTLQEEDNTGSFLEPKNDFLKTVNQEIEKNLDDDDFRASHIARKIGVCDMQLHRKLKKLARLSPANYIRKYRLWRSRSFLKDPAHRISQVCFMVGFRSLEYFSRSFKKEFGVCPSDYRIGPNRCLNSSKEC